MVGRYRLVKLLGEGGMGAVWEALHLMTEKPVALKFLKAQGDVALRKRFYREARAASAVHHKNVVAIHDVVELDDGLFMVMDRLEGEPLESLLERQRSLSLQRTCQILGPVVDAVRAAHAAGIVHRDLKPANVFLAYIDGHEEVRVLDFGIAKIMGDGATAPVDGKLTTTGAVMGTPFYMAPEQMWGERVDARADVWALGVVLYECLAGRRPIDGENIGQLLKAIANQSIAPLGEIDPRLPAPLVDLVGQMLQTDRTQRLADLERVATELAKHAGDATHITISHRPEEDRPRVSLVNPLGRTQTSEPPTVDAMSVDRKASAVSGEVRGGGSRFSARYVVAVAVAAIAVGVVVWRVQKMQETPAAPTTPTPSIVVSQARTNDLPTASAAPPASAVSLPAATEAAAGLDASVPLTAFKRPPPRPSAVVSSTAPIAPAKPAPSATGVGGLHTAAPF